MSRPGARGLGGLLVIFGLGLLCGAQLALYLYDRYDDGVADPLLLGIGLLMIAASLGFLVFYWRREHRR